MNKRRSRSGRVDEACRWSSGHTPGGIPVLVAVGQGSLCASTTRPVALPSWVPARTRDILARYPAVHEDP